VRILALDFVELEVELASDTRKAASISSASVLNIAIHQVK